MGGKPAGRLLRRVVQHQRDTPQQDLGASKLCTSQICRRVLPFSLIPHAVTHRKQVFKGGLSRTGTEEGVQFRCVDGIDPFPFLLP